MLGETLNGRVKASFRIHVVPDNMRRLQLQHDVSWMP